MDAEDEIDAGLDRLTTPTTAAALVRDRGEHRSVKVMSKRRLKELVRSAVTQELSAYADRLGEEEREAMAVGVQQRVRRLLDHLKNDEKELAGIREEAAAVEERIRATLGDEARDHPLLVQVQELVDLLAHAMRLAQYSLHDAATLKEESAALQAVGPSEATEEQARRHGRWLLELCRGCDAVTEEAAVLDLAVALDEAESEADIEPHLRAVRTLLQTRLAGTG